MGIRKKIKRESFFYKLYLYKNLYIDNKIFIKRNTYSQFGEDKFIYNFFNNFKSGIYVDIGCFHPLKYSNTAKLYYENWRGYNIDINPVCIDLFNLARPKDKNFNAFIDKISGEKKKYFYENFFSAVSSFDQEHLKKFDIQNFHSSEVVSVVFDDIVKDNINFLNIDCEGYDLEVIKLINLKKYTPELICIEVTDNNAEQIFDHLNKFNYKFVTKFEISYIFKKS